LPLFADVPATVEYLLHVRPLARLEVLSLKTELTAGSEPQPFGLAGYDDEDNELDTLDGLQISWFIGSQREIAVFDRNRQNGPIVTLVPMRAGKGAVIAVVNDPNYAGLEPGVMEFSVAAPLFLEPDGVHILEGAAVTFNLTERGVNQEGEDVFSQVALSGDGADYRLEIEDASVASLDVGTATVTGIKEGQETVVRNAIRRQYGSYRQRGFV